jgi:hypothetical protein
VHSKSRYAIAVATTALAATLAACGSGSTSPNGPSPQSLAEHFDSIYSSLLAQGTAQDTLVALFVAAYVEVGPAYGAHEASFTATTANGTAGWNGFSFEEAVTAADGDSLFYTVAYDNLSLSNFLVTRVLYSNNGTNQGGQALGVLNLSTYNVDSTFSGSSTINSTGNACTLQTGLAADTIMTAVLTEQLGAGYACQFASFTNNIDVVFPVNAGLGPLETVSITGATFNGVRFSGTGSGASHIVSAIPSRRAAVLQRLEAFWNAHH